LAEKLEVMELGEGSRTMIKAAEMARKKASKRKKAGRKYRALEAGRNGEVDIEVVDQAVEITHLKESEARARGEKEEITGRSSKVEPP
jgi:hypothetical protein